VHDKDKREKVNNKNSFFFVVVIYSINDRLRNPSAARKRPIGVD
jgi:hypothetical protein